MILKNANDRIHGLPRPECPLCASAGILLYADLNDRLFGTPGTWNIKKCSNPDCKMIWIDPLPSEDELAQAYKQYYTHKDVMSVSRNMLKILYNLIKQNYFALKYGYSHNLPAHWLKFLGLLIYLHPLQRAAIDQDVMYLSSKIKGNLLDVGCGGGQRLRLMQDFGWSAEGVDIDPAAVECARKQGLNVRLGKLEDQGYPENHFDAITMSHMIEHVYEPLTLLAECYRILKPGGKLVLVTPNAESWAHHLFRNAWVHLDPPRHIYVFCSQTLQRFVEKALFKKIRIFTTLRWNDITFSGSKTIRQSGKFLIYDMQTRMTRIWAAGMELLEFLIVKVKPSRGEEIVLIAEKAV